MEAVRIIQSLNLHPRRTIRVALWTGEEEGLLGSAAYVKKHFGYDPDANLRRDRQRRAAAAAATEPSDSGTPAPATEPAHQIVKEADYDRLSVYFNLDNGTGKIRGVYLQQNAAAMPIFEAWLRPFEDLGAKTLTMRNTGGTDHLSFDAVGLPGFQFIQDEADYNTRTHHSNMDVYDRAQRDDLMQASVIMAAFAYNAAMRPEMFPRKPLPKDAAPALASAPAPAGGGKATPAPKAATPKN
jgi:Zn-dependent M28 family amino/carboxypeptidase